ncbi:MAG: imidazole glycerol phosphate synthase subunit HisF [Chitinivibrionales bacterium]|nr:imidazole glycerol phosphate synthase subunit HisF [Chitinivibrionales bacterium]
MLQVRAIPVLLLSGEGFYKTKRFQKPAYLGDPINILRIFNDKEVDEILILDIEATPGNALPNYELLTKIASECFMPLSYGGGLDSIEKIAKIFSCGFEKVCLNTAAYKNPVLISQAAAKYGSQSVMVSIDVKKNFLGRYDTYVLGGRKKTGKGPVDFAQECERRGAGEVVINSIDNDGVMNGYDVKLVKQVADAVSIPVIACGGAGTVEHMRDAVRTGQASATAAGSMFVFQGPHRAVLINVPSRDALESVFAE